MAGPGQSPPARRRTSRAGRWSKLAAGLVNLAAAPVAAAWPRSRRRWVFGHEGDAFAGNPKYLFLWVALHRPDIRATWITGDEALVRRLRASGHRARRRRTVAGALERLRAGVFLFAHDVADVGAPFAWGAVRLNLWHGVGIKGLAVKRGRGWAGRVRSAMLVPYDEVATTSDFTQAHFADQFGLPPTRCPQLGYPRLDPARAPRLAEAARRVDGTAGFDPRRGGFAEAYLYVPTYRDGPRGFVADALPDLPALSAALARRNAILHVKLHGRTAEAVAGLGNVVSWDDRVDLYSCLADFDLLITDYSSIYYDFLCASDRPTLFYVFDLAQYLARDRSLVHPFEDNVDGPRAGDFAELCRALGDGTALAAGRSPRSAAIRERFWGGSDRPASARVVDHLLGARGIAPPP